MFCNYKYLVLLFLCIAQFNNIAAAAEHDGFIGAVNAACMGGLSGAFIGLVGGVGARITIRLFGQKVENLHAYTHFIGFVIGVGTSLHNYYKTPGADDFPPPPYLSPPPYSSPRAYLSPRAT